MRYFQILLLGLFTIAPPLWSEEVDVAAEQISLGLHLEIFEDKNGSRTFQDIRRETFAPSQTETPNFGFSKSAYWLRFELKNPGDKDVERLLELGYPHLDSVTLFLDDGSEKKTGDTLDFFTRDVLHRYFIFKIDVPKQSIQRIYLRVSSESSLQFPLTLWSPVRFGEKSSAELFGFGIYYGIMVVMFLYNLFLLLFVKDKSYLFYIFYIVSFSLFQFTLNGFSYEYLWPNSPEWGNKALPIFMAFGSLWILQFSQVFLITKTNLPRFHKALQIIKFVLIPVMLVPFLLRYRVSMQITISFVIITAIFVMIAGIMSWVSGYRAARYYLLAWTMLLLGALLAAFKALGILPNMFVTEYGIQIGSALEVMLLSVALADRINILKREHELSQAAAIRAQEDLLESKSKLLDSVSRFVPQQFLRYLNRDTIEEVTLGDSIELEMALLFTDIRSFTSISEKMSSEDNFRFLNSYLKRMTPVIQSHKGFVDKYIGDAIMALFPHLSDDATKAAIEMQLAVKDYNHHRNADGYETISVGMGLHFGSLMLGTVGSELRLDTTVIGDTVNIASRVEALTKTFRAKVIATDSIYRKWNDPECYLTREIDSVLVRGKANPIVLYEVFDADDDDVKERKLETMSLFSLALSYYKAGDFSDARATLQEAQSIDPTDQLHSIYIQRCDKLLAAPPKGAWRGISRMK